MLPKVIFGTFVVLLSFSSTSAIFPVISRGDCPKVELQQNFNLTNYLGLWFSYEDFDTPFQYGMTCISALYSMIDSRTISVVNFGYEEPSIWNGFRRRRERIQGQATVFDPNNPAGLNVRFSEGQPDFTVNEGPNYNILATDYESYSVVYSCSKIPYVPIKIEIAWILTRDRHAEPDNIEDLKSMMRGYGINTDNFKKVDHSNCN